MEIGSQGKDKIKQSLNFSDDIFGASSLNSPVKCGYIFVWSIYLNDRAWFEPTLNQPRLQVNGLQMNALMYGA